MAEYKEMINKMINKMNNYTNDKFNYKTNKNFLLVSIAFLGTLMLCSCGSNVAENDTALQETSGDYQDTESVVDENSDEDSYEGSEESRNYDEMFYEYGYTYTASWDFSDESIFAECKTEGGYLTTLTLNNSSTGATFDFICDKCRLENGVLTIEDGGSLILADEMGGLCAVNVTLDLSVENSGFFDGGYDIYDAKEVSSGDELIWVGGIYLDNSVDVNSTWFAQMPNYFRIYPQYGGSLAIKSLSITYDDVTTKLGYASLYTDFYGYYIEGDYYDDTKEYFSNEECIFDFYLLVYADSPKFHQDGWGDTLSNDCPVYGVDASLYTVGNLLSADGSVKDKSEKLAVGDMIEVSMGNYNFDVELPVCEPYLADNLKELMPANFVTSTGDVNVLVVPLYFEDQADKVSEEYTEKIYSYLGRVLSGNGSVTDYTVNDYYSMSDYFDAASYGQLNLNSFVTDWYGLEGTFEESSWASLSDDTWTLDEITEWINGNYSDMLKKLDQDGDGLYDAVVFLVAEPDDISDGFSIASYQGAYNSNMSYSYARAITDGSGAGINHFTMVNIDQLTQFADNNAGALCHEFSHQLGLIDYYDVYYSGIDAIGGYDMQDNNEGDWNVFSKFAAGWISPTVVSQEDIDEGITLTINAFESDGSSIVIPTANTEYNEDGSISPFSEYLILDLFTPEGLYADTCADFGLTKAGVRIYHVDARMLTINATDNMGYDYTVGTDLCTNAYNENGRYELELIQAGGNNTFTDLSSEYINPQISDKDLFHAGDTFSAATHGSFFYEGRMDDESEIDFKITVVSIDNGTATVKISR